MVFCDDGSEHNLCSLRVLTAHHGRIAHKVTPEPISSPVIVGRREF